MPKPPTGHPETMQGTRVLDGTVRLTREPGTFGRVRRDGEWVWMGRTPNGLLGDFSEHDVVEHDDGMITVTPSVVSDFIIVDDDADERLPGAVWHGYLEHGIWRSA
jgi:hypothetical protein